MKINKFYSIFIISILLFQFNLINPIKDYPIDNGELPTHLDFSNSKMQKGIIFTTELPDLKNYVIIYQFKSIEGYLIEYSVNNPNDYSQLLKSGRDITHSAFSLNDEKEITDYNTNTVDSEVMEVNEVWNHGFNGSGLIIAVLDSGVNFNHPALLNKKAGEISFRTREFGYTSDEGPEDNFGHGTAVASLISGYDPSSSFYGMAYGSKIVNVKVGVSSQISVTAAAVIAALDWVISNDSIDVVNLSLGEPEEGSTTDILERLVLEGTNRGKIMVVAAGNEGSAGNNPFTISSPGSSPAGITVGAINYQYFLAGFSSEGPTYGWEAKPDIVAPGVQVQTANILGGYRGESGTSFATPLVAGISALGKQIILNQGNTFSPGTIKAAISGSGTDLGMHWSQQGNGLVNASKMMSNLLTYPSLSFAFPRSLPYWYYDEVPLKENIKQPITLTSSSLGEWEISSTFGNISNHVTLQQGENPSYSSVYYLEFQTDSSDNMGLYTGNITLLSPDNHSINITLTIRVIEEAKQRMIISLLHTIWDTIHDSPYNRPLERVIGWDMFDYVQLLRENGIWVEELTSGELTTTELINYDILMIPSAFPNYYPDFYDHEIPRTTELSYSELKAVDWFIDNGGKLIADFGGVSGYDSTYSSRYYYEDSILSLLSLLGIGVSEFDYYSTESTVTMNNNLFEGMTITTGKSILQGGIPVDDPIQTNAVGVLGPNQLKAFINTARNWRDYNAMRTTDISFIQALTNWISNGTGILSFDYEVDSDTTLYFEVPEGVTRNFEISIKEGSNEIYGFSINKVFNVYEVVIPGKIYGEITVDVMFGQEHIFFTKYLDNDPPEIEVIEEPSWADTYFNWTIKIKDDRTIIPSNINLMFDGSNDFDVINLRYSSNTIYLVIDPEQVKNQQIEEDIHELFIEIIDMNGNYANYTLQIDVSLDQIMNRDLLKITLIVSSIVLICLILYLKRQTIQNYLHRLIKVIKSKKSS
ncbi:MAG: S8 family serine peptidase [Candidatus Heimdallarchaeota archaeon]|nr:S8 family serine peptidase [Candidatus Heimdallarchaeota archaeon]